MCFLEDVQISNILIKMIQELAWWWIYESKHVATFMIDNKLDMFWMNRISEFFLDFGVLPITRIWLFLTYFLRD